MSRFFFGYDRRDLTAISVTELAPADDCPPEMPTADELCPHCVFQLTDNIFDWSLCKMLDKPLYVGNVSGKGRDVYVYAKDSETALQRLEIARKQLMMEVM